MGERLFKRGLIWYAWVPQPGGGLRKQSTLCTDKKAALVVAAKLERAAVDPDHAAQDEAETGDLLSRYLASRERRGRAEGTLHHVRVKSGHLKRLLPSRAAEITHARVEEYIDARLAEGARRTTVKKELRVLKATLKLAAKNHLFREMPDNVIPDLEDDYEPRERFLTPWELVALVSALGVDDPRAAMVAFIVATGARLGEARRARYKDIEWRDGTAFVSIRGTKTKLAKGVVPVVGAGQAVLLWSLDRVHRHGDQAMFPPWTNVRRDLAAACDRAGIPRCSPNDLRRTFATWLQQAGAGNDLIAKAMRHTDTRQVERVYGRMSPRDLARLLVQRTTHRPHGTAMPGGSAPSDPEPCAASPEARADAPKGGCLAGTTSEAAAAVAEQPPLGSPHSQPGGGSEEPGATSERESGAADRDEKVSRPVTSRPAEAPNKPGALQSLDAPDPLAVGSGAELMGGGARAVRDSSRRSELAGGSPEAGALQDVGGEAKASLHAGAPSDPEQGPRAGAAATNTGVFSHPRAGMLMGGSRTGSETIEAHPEISTPQDSAGKPCPGTESNRRHGDFQAGPRDVDFEAGISADRGGSRPAGEGAWDANGRFPLAAACAALIDLALRAGIAVVP